MGIELRLTIHQLGIMPLGGCLSSCCSGAVDRSLMVHIMSSFWFQPVLCNWCNKGCVMCYRVCGMVLVKDTLLLRVAHEVLAAEICLVLPSDHLLYIRCHNNINKMC